MVSTGIDTILALRPRYIETMNNSNILPFSHIFTYFHIAMEESDL